MGYEHSRPLPSGETWVLGSAFEKKVYEEFQSLGISVERGDMQEFRNPDFIIQFKAVPKKRTTPLRNAQRTVGIDPSKCVSVDIEALAKPFKYEGNIVFVFDIDYTTSGFETKGKFIISSNTLLKLMETKKNRFLTFSGRNRFFVCIDEMHPYEPFSELIGFGMNDNWENNLNIRIRVDAKKRVEPFFHSDRLIGVATHKCVTIDNEKLSSYIGTGDPTLLIFEIDYTSKEDLKGKEYDLKGKYVISIRELVRLMNKHPERLKPYMDHAIKRDRVRFYVNVDELTEYNDFLKVVQ